MRGERGARGRWAPPEDTPAKILDPDRPLSPLTERTSDTLAADDARSSATLGSAAAKSNLGQSLSCGVRQQHANWRAPPHGAFIALHEPRSSHAAVKFRAIGAAATPSGGSQGTAGATEDQLAKLQAEPWALARARTLAEAQPFLRMAHEGTAAAAGGVSAAAGRSKSDRRSVRLLFPAPSEAAAEDLPSPARLREPPRHGRAWLPGLARGDGDEEFAAGSVIVRDLRAPWSRVGRGPGPRADDPRRKRAGGGLSPSGRSEAFGAAP